MKKQKEGFLKVEGGKIWFERLGKQKNIPLVLVHGGPGYPHYGLNPLRKLDKDRTVVFYDQLGCGKSDRPKNKKLWRVDRFVEELEALRNHLGFEKMYLLGHSWGGALVAEYSLKYQKHVAGIVFAGPLLSTPRWILEANRLKKTLPLASQKIIDKHEKNGTTDSKEYGNATKNYYKRYWCRLAKTPKEILKNRKEAGKDVYSTMWGPSEFHCTGNLKNFDCTPRLPEIKLPVLFTCGRFDEAGVDAVKDFQKLIKGSKMKIFEKSAHQAQLEETEKYLQIVGKFLNEVDR